jgi:hypothetical protein
MARLPGVAVAEFNIELCNTHQPACNPAIRDLVLLAIFARTQIGADSLQQG